MGVILGINAFHGDARPRAWGGRVAACRGRGEVHPGQALGASRRMPCAMWWGAPRGESGPTSSAWPSHASPRLPHAQGDARAHQLALASAKREPGAHLGAVRGVAGRLRASSVDGGRRAAGARGGASPRACRLGLLPSGFERAACLTVDGFGDFVSTMHAVGEGNEIRVLDRVHYPHSVGLFYTR